MSWSGALWIIIFLFSMRNSTLCFYFTIHLWHTPWEWKCHSWCSLKDGYWCPESPWLFSHCKSPSRRPGSLYAHLNFPTNPSSAIAIFKWHHTVWYYHQITTPINSCQFSPSHFWSPAWYLISWYPCNPAIDHWTICLTWNEPWYPSMDKIMHSLSMIEKSIATCCCPPGTFSTPDALLRPYSSWYCWSSPLITSLLLSPHMRWSVYLMAWNNPYFWYNRWICCSRIHSSLNMNVPSTITTNCSAQFESSLFSTLTHLLGIKRMCTIAYHTCANRMAKWFHRQLKVSLKVSSDSLKWTEILPSFSLAFILTSNNTSNALEPS